MKPYITKNKKRRLKKKLFLDEFAMLGFELSCETTIVDFDTYDLFVDEFIDFIDAQGLSFGGGGLELFEGFLCCSQRYQSVTEAQKSSVIDWLNAHSKVKSTKTSELIDANYF